MKKLPFVHIGLFILTFMSTLIAGALQKGINILEQPARAIEGFSFALTLMTILLSHELGHYFASMKHHTKATLPYFIPAPSIIGTFGAFIKMKSPIVTRKALIDIGASGPIAGFVVSIIASSIGLSLSNVVSNAGESGVLSLGDSIIFSALSRLIIGVAPDSHDILLHPVAFAGWIGFFVTSMNLIPIGQLDGGHIAYALLGEKHGHISKILVAVLAAVGIFYWEGWLMWAGIMFVLGLKHPPIIFWERPLDKRRRNVGVISLVIFVITFIPYPFKLL